MEHSNLITNDYLRGIVKIIEGMNLILKTNNSNVTICLGTSAEQEKILQNLLQSLSKENLI